MKKILHILFVGILLLGAVVSAHAANGIIETKYYSICAGDTIMPDAHQTRIGSDTIVYDTIRVTDPSMDSIYVYVVNVYSVFFKTESRIIETGTSFMWRDLLIDHAGTYDRVYKTIHDCDSTYQLVVTERAGKPEKPVTFTICDGESVEFNGQTYSASGTYYSDMNADTVYKITIVKHPSQLYQQTAVIDATHPYYWQYMLNGELHTDTLTEPGVYEYTTQNPETGCNDTHRLIVTRDETSYHFEEAFTICENEEFSWHGLSNLNRQGIGTTTDYFDRFVSQAGKDSIYHLALTVNPVPRRTQTLTFCESIDWNGRTYTESGLVIDTLTSVLGCDSIITTILARGIPFHRHDTATIVPGETMTWHGQTINNSGLYEDKHVTSMGCDSVYTLGVGMKEAVPQMDMRTDYISICYGEEYVWRGKTYREPNRYVDTLYTDNTKTEVDSLFVLVLTVNPRYDLTERVTFRDFPVNYRNTLIQGPGIYPIHYTSSLGCDSIITLMVDREVIRDELTVTICPGETYLWRGHVYQESHRYVETETDANGVDSVEHILNLTVKYIPETRITRTICRGTSYTFADQTLTESGIYTHTFHDTGCDSVVVLSLNVLNADTVKYIRHINEGESYTWHNKVYHETGVDYYTTQNRFGCDSTEMLILTVNHVDTIDSVATICPSETLEWHGIRASQNGVFTNPEQQPTGDFIYYRLHLTVRELQQVDVDFTVCGNENVVYNGKTYTEAGYYYDMLGCDTLVRIHVKKNPLQVYETHGTLGGEHGFTWTYMDNGTEKTQVFNQPGTYEYESPNSETGCSDLWRLVLTKDESSYHFVETLTICEGDDFTWHGLTNLSRQIGNNQHYFDAYQTRTGNDSIYELILTVLPAKRTVSTVTFCGETTWKGHTYTQSAVVYDTLVSATGCDSIVRINLDKASSFYKHDTATIVQGEILHWHGLQISTDGLYRDAYTTQFGCDSIYEIGVGLIAATPQTNLYTIQFSICDGDVYTWRGKDYMTGGTYVDTVWTEGREQIDSIFVLRLTVLQSYSDTIVRHMYSCSQEAGIRYNGRDYFQSQAVIENLRTVGGCDSIVKIFMHVGESLYQRDTVRIGDTKVPYAWRPNNDTTIYLSTPGTHTYSKPAEGGCDNVWELYLEIYPSFLREDSIAICESELPFYWQNGPDEHRNDAISGQPGQTRLVEYNYPGSIIGVDSIYRLKLYVMPQAKHVEQITLCEGQQKTLPNGKTYYMLESDSVYRDTVYFANPNMPGCDSIVYYEIQQFASLTQTETKILHVGETIHWHGQTITSGGPYQDIVPAAAAGGCDSIYNLNVVQEMREEMVVCKIDTPNLYPVIWRDDTLYTTGLWTDTVYENGFIKEYYSLDLTITLPYDTTIYLKGCDVAGVTWRDETFMQDTAFIDRIPVTPYNPKNPCDSVFHVNIKVGKTYNITITDTICESDLPYILGRQNPDTIWTDARHRPQPHTDTTACGCDSTVNLVLYITPTLAKNDSTFACEDEIAEHPVILGDTVNPWFQYREGGKYADIWRGKWKGIEYTHDTIVWDCNHEYFHHIIVRPRQSQPKDTTYYLCEGDSVQLFWPKDTMIKTPGIYYDTVVNVSPWWDTKHSQYIHNDKAYACDSVVRWTVLYADALTVDTTERHIALGDSIFWGGEYRYFTGYYDSICDSQQGLQDSEQRFCKEHHWLHLTADTVYRYTDTIHICHPAYLEYTHTFADQHEVKFNTPDQDTAIIHVTDSTKQIQYGFYDHYYTLVAYYHQQYLTQIEDTICEGGEYRWDIHRNNTTIERWLTKEGTYRDTLEAMNGCDSIIELHLRVRYRNEVTHKTVMITDRELPYLWSHTWRNGQTDTTVVDTLHYSGEYRFVMPSIHGCDSVDSLHLTVHETHVFYDTIQVCSPINITHTHVWATGYEQQFTVPQDDQKIHYYDTLRTAIPMDSIYDLYVDFHQQYLTQIIDTICEGAEYRWDIHRDNTTIERWLTKEGTYRDTLEAMNGCDSIIELHLRVRYRNEVTHKTVMITDRELPYLWSHTWRNGQTDTTVVDTLHYSGEYRFVMPSIHGCDSVDSLHLTVHETHVFYDTIQVCSPINITHTHVWATGYEQQFTVPQDDQKIHYYDTLRTAIPMDSIYDLYVDFHQQYLTQIIDTICEGAEYRFDIHRNNTTIERWLSEEGTYRDTLEAMNGCDSIIELHLRVRYRNEVTHKTVMITDRELPYLWPHTWRNGRTDTTVVDTLHYTGEYRFVMPSIHGCDSVDSLHLTIHETHVFYDTIQVCSPINITHTHVWATGYEQQFTVPQDDQQIHYYDTLRTFIPMDSIYDLYVDYHVQTITYLDTTLCEGDSLRFGLTKSHTPRFLTETGIYRDTLTRTANGCDSIIELRLNVFPRYNNYQTVHIADTDTPYIWPHYQGGHLLTNDTLYATGEYVYRFQSDYSCDSIDSLSLRVHITYLFRDTVQICQSETPYTWYDKQDIYETGEYIKHFQTHDGYDSTYVRYVKVMPVTYDTIEATICEGDSLRFGLSKQNKPRFLYNAGTYTDTLVNSFNCDSIVTLRLNIYPKHYEHHQVDIADTDTPYVWPHYQDGHLLDSDTLYAAGEYVYHFQSSHGCDSIDSLSLRVHTTYLFRDTVTICSDQTPYTWYDKQDIYETGEYIKHFQTHDGYDSTYVRYVQVLPVIHDTIRHAMCEGTDYLFNGKRYTEAGSYTDTLVSMHGCDSIVTLVLTVNKSVYLRIPADIYEGEHYTFYGVDYTTSGTYRHYGQTAEGCDSIAELFLTVHPQIDTTVIICKNELPYTMTNRWSGETKTLYQAGIYRDDTTYVNGQRTFFTLQLIVNEPQFDTVRAAICEGSSYAFRGIALTESGIYRDTVRAANGCDSITTLILTVNQPYYNHRVEHIFEGQQIQFFDTVCKTTGTYYHYGTTPEGCDSTSVLQLIVHQLVDTIVTVCSDDLPYMWVNKWDGTTTPLYTAGIYRNDTTYLNGERMFYGLQLVVNQPQFDTIRHSMCQGSSYDFKGNTYYEQGIYRDTLAAANGCDSIVTLILTVNEPYYNVIRETILEGHTYDFFGDTYSTSGTYTHYARTPEGCDSTTVLQLSVHPLVDTIITVCDNDIPVIWYNRWNGNVEQFYSEGLYRNDTIINGEKRFYGIQVNIHTQVFDTIRHSMCQGSSYDFKGNTYYEQGIYRDTLAAANGCDSIVTLILTVNEPYYKIIRETVLEGQYYVFFGDTIRETMTVSHSGRTPEGCDSTTVLELTVHQLVDTVVTVCSSDLPYVWTNRWNGLEEKFYGAGTYRNDTSINGERLYYGIKLVVTEPSSSTIYREICEGDNYNFNGRMLSIKGEYRDTIRNTIGCDSIIILNLNVLKKYHHTVERTIFEGDTVHFEGQTYSAAGIYPFRYTSSFGCDSIVELHLYVNRVYEDSISICSNELPYIWHGKTIYESGVYRDTVTNTEGRQTILGLMINVLPITHAPEPQVATICEGDFYRFAGKILTEQGIYYDTLVAQNGCDSIVMLSLQVMPVNYQTLTKRIFEGDSIEFNGQWLKTSGVYERRTKNQYGCTDTEQLILTVLKEFRMDTTAYVCDNELPFIWRGYEYNESGDYTLPIAWTDSSRVVKTLHLTVNPAFYGYRNISICQGDTFKFKGNSYTENGEFLDVIPSGHGCDSIIRYIISVHPTFDHIFEKHISDKQPYDFHGRILTQSGTYEWTGKTVAGCDSVEHLLLTVHPSYFITDTVDVCQSDTSMYPFKWRGYEFIKSGTYRDTTLTSYGFDSICEVVLKVHPAYYLYEQYEIGEGQTLRLHGKDITKPGVYEDTLTSIFGCDSIYHIVVNLKRVKEITLIDSICQGDYYDFFGKQLTQNGKYVHVSDDKTTVTTLTLKVLPVSITEKRVVIANNKTGSNYYIYNSKLYNNLPLGPSEFSEIYRNQYNCDSIFRLIIVVTNRVSEWDQIPLCPGHEIKIDGDTIRQAGMYTFPRRNKDNGELDSLYRVEVFDAPDFDFPTIQRTICDGDTVFIGGKAITRGGHHDILLKTVHGCDSIYHLDLTVNPSYHFITDTTIIDYESVTWRGKTYNQSGTYDRSWPTIHDCDSTYSLRLTVIPTQRDTLTKTICADDSYFWRGKLYNTDGFYSDTVRSIQTNFSAIYSLRLIVAYPTTITSAKTSEVCADDDAFDIEFEYDGAKPEYYNVYFDALAKREGFRDVINARFGSDMIAHIDLPKFSTVAYESDSESHPQYVRPDYYTMRLVLDNGICGISQSTDLTLLVKYPSWIIQQNWDDVVAPLRPELNGGYNFVQYEWYINNELVPMHGLGYLHNDNLQIGDEVVMSVVREGENYSIPTCPIVITKAKPTATYPTLDVYPTQAPRHAPVVTLQSEQDGSYSIYSSTGTLIETGTFSQGAQQLTLPAVNGIWFIRTQTMSGQTDTHKIMIY